jgi:hypothetical protein
MKFLITCYAYQSILKDFFRNLAMWMKLHDIVHQNRSFGRAGRKSQEAAIQTRRECTKSCGKDKQMTRQLMANTIWLISLSLILVELYKLSTHHLCFLLQAQIGMTRNTITHL